MLVGVGGSPTPRVALGLGQGVLRAEGGLLRPDDAEPPAGDEEGVVGQTVVAGILGTPRRGERIGGVLVERLGRSHSWRVTGPTVLHQLLQSLLVLTCLSPASQLG